MANQKEKIQKGLSFDLEHWHTATVIRDHVTSPTDKIDSSVDIVLDILNKHNVNATFSIVGEVTGEYSEFIARVSMEVHELAIHDHTHTPLFGLDRESFALDLNRSVNAIENAADVSVNGFRAPNFSVTRQTEWALDELAHKEFVYDSSVFPIKTPMHGVRGAHIRSTLSVTVCPSQMSTITTDSPRFRWQYTPGSEFLSLVDSILASSRDRFYSGVLIH